MAVFSAEKVQEMVEEKEAEYKKLEEEYWFLKEEYEELEETCKDFQKLNNKLVKNNKAANRDFFILAVAYASTLMLMIYLFIR
jgi:hypothetical protein|nr:MAG TPA: Sec20 [Caudoviricetes sp.]